MKFEQLQPMEIERRSFEIIGQELGGKQLNPLHEHIIKRVIHTTADFSYADTLYFSENIEEIIANAILSGAIVVTDTNMAKAGINAKAISKFGAEVVCFIADDDVVSQAANQQTTRAMAAVEKAAKQHRPAIFVIGNAPTALIKICELHNKGEFSPLAVIAVPVGFVNVSEAKEELIASGLPCIVSQGRKGGSNVAAAVVNAIVYKLLIQ